MSEIDGVVIKKLNQISDERGKIMHMLRSDDPLFEKFGEIYFSTIYPQVIKGWHLHSLGFSMQVTALKESARRFYEPLGRIWYGLDRLLFRAFGWEAFSLPGRFILCSIKLTRK